MTISAFVPIDNTAQIGVYSLLRFGYGRGRLEHGSRRYGHRPVADLYTYKITRGLFDTIPREWPSGTRGWFLGDNGGPIDPTEAASGTEKTYKIMSRTDGGVFPQNRAESDLLHAERPSLSAVPAGQYQARRIGLRRTRIFIMLVSRYRRL